MYNVHLIILINITN